MTRGQPIRLSELDEVVVSGSQAYLAMRLFLNDYFDRTEGHGALSTLINDLEIEASRTSTDPAALGDWLDCLRRVF